MAGMKYLRLVSGFVVIIATMVALGLVAFEKTQSLADLTTSLYEHPLAVSNAVLEANSDIISMHRHMKDVALARNSRELERAVARVREDETHAYQHFKVIMDRFLGEKSRIVTAKKAFADWAFIRSEVIRLTRQKKYAEAAALTKGRGAKHVVMMTVQMDNLIDFARNKAAEFLKNSEEQYQAFRTLMIWLLSGAFVMSGGVAYFVVTSVRKADSERDRALEEITRQATELDGMNKELSQFNYVVSHDLKAPLRAIHNYADFIAEDLGGKLDEEQEGYLVGLRNAVQEGEDLIEDILELSQLGRKKLDHERLDLGQFLKDTINLMNMPEEVSVDVQGRWPVIEAPPSLLRQVFRNLITNGVKFNRSENKIIQLSCREIDDLHCEITVTDNGIGIPERFHDKIFEAFQRLHTLEQFEGTGIGLAIVVKAASLMGGRVRVESRDGKGTSFYVIIRKRQEEE